MFQGSKCCKLLHFYPKAVNYSMSIQIAVDELQVLHNAAFLTKHKPQMLSTRAFLTVHRLQLLYACFPQEMQAPYAAFWSSQAQNAVSNNI